MSSPIHTFQQQFVTGQSSDNRPTLSVAEMMSGVGVGNKVVQATHQSEQSMAMDKLADELIEVFEAAESQKTTLPTSSFEKLSDVENLANSLYQTEGPSPKESYSTTAAAYQKTINVFKRSKLEDMYQTNVLATTNPDTITTTDKPLVILLADDHDKREVGNTNAKIISRVIETVIPEARLPELKYFLIESSKKFPSMPTSKLVIDETASERVHPLVATAIEEMFTCLSMISLYSKQINQNQPGNPQKDYLIRFRHAKKILEKTLQFHSSHEKDILNLINFYTNELQKTFTHSQVTVPVAKIKINGSEIPIPYINFNRSPVFQSEKVIETRLFQKFMAARMLLRHFRRDDFRLDTIEKLGTGLVACEVGMGHVPYLIRELSKRKIPFIALGHQNIYGLDGFKQAINEPGKERTTCFNTQCKPSEVLEHYQKIEKETREKLLTLGFRNLEAA